MSDHWERRWEWRHRERTLLFQARALDIDLSPYRTGDDRWVSSAAFDELEYVVVAEANLRTPCRECHTFDHPRDGLTCDPCADRIKAEDDAKAAYLHALYVGSREPLGKRMSDNHGCVDRVTIADRLTLGGESPYS